MEVLMGLSAMYLVHRIGSWIRDAAPSLVRLSAHRELLDQVHLPDSFIELADGDPTGVLALLARFGPGGFYSQCARR
jgi:hypothetical protein